MRALILTILLLWPFSLGAQDGPRPPCGGAPETHYADPGALPNVQVWSDGGLGAGWAPPGCTGWMARGFRVLVALAASFRHDGGADDLLTHFGAVSALRGIRYWSTSDKDWRVLITDAAALDGPDAKRRRSDFPAATMRSGGDLYFMQNDSRSSGEVIYRMRVRESDPARLVIAIENVGPVRAFLMTLFHPGDLQSVYFLERRAPGIWGFYSLSRTGEGASPLAGGHKASYVNRAVAFYRHVAGVPTDQNPPVAP
jgi:hypothetical protein